MDDRTLALLGDCAAQERMTERGELVVLTSAAVLEAGQGLFNRQDTTCG